MTDEEWQRYLVVQQRTQRWSRIGFRLAIGWLLAMPLIQAVVTVWLHRN